MPAPAVITVEELREEIGAPVKGVGDAKSFTPDSVLEGIINRQVKQTRQNIEEQVEQGRPVGELGTHVKKVDIDLEADGPVAVGAIPEQYMPFAFDWGVVDGDRVEKMNDVREMAQINPWSPTGFQITGQEVEVLPKDADAITLKLVTRETAKSAMFRMKVPQLNAAIKKEAQAAVEARIKIATQVETETLDDIESI